MSWIGNLGNMGFSDVYTDIIAKANTILVDNPIPTPKPANNIQKTPSNVNQVFKYIGIWNDQIDIETQSLKKGDGFIVKCPSLFIEFISGEGSDILGGVTQYMDACVYFHIFSDQLATDNRSDYSNLIDANFEIFYLRDLITSNFNGFHTSFSSAMMSRYDKEDYKHNTITKYLRGFSFCFNDTKGSMYDPKSFRYQTSVQINATLNQTPQSTWISGTEYVAFANCVYLNLAPNLVGEYLCTTTNNDATFEAVKWAYVPIWVSGTAYHTDNFIYIGGFCYQCIISNSDIIFTPAHWYIICRI